MKSPCYVYTVEGWSKHTPTPFCMFAHMTKREAMSYATAYASYCDQANVNVGVRLVTWKDGHEIRKELIRGFSDEKVQA